MSEIAPPPPPPPTPPPSSPAAPPTVVVANPPRGLADLAIGARLDGVIVTPEKAGQIEIQTAFGRLTVQTGFPLPKEGPLQLQVSLKGPHLQLLITSINGLPPLAALRVLGLIPGAAGATLPGAAAGAAAGAGAPQGSAAGTGGGPLGAIPGAPAATGGGALPGVAAEPAAVNLSVGATLTATLLRAGPATGQASPAAAVQAGASAAPTATAAGTGTGAPAPGGGQAPSPQGTAPAGTGAAAGSPARPGAADGGSAQGASRAPAPGQAPVPPTGPQVVPGTQFSIRITAFQPAVAGSHAGPLPQPVSGGVLAPGSALNGVVTGSASSSGHLIVQTHGGTFVIATGTPAPPGSTVNFQILSQAASLPAAGAIDTIHADPRLMLTGGWPSLQEAVLALEEINPAAAQQLIHAVLPRPGGALAANMLFFLVALAGGTLRGWIGDGPARILQKLRPQLLGRLRDDFGQIGRISEDSGSGEWRTLLIPLHNGAQIEQIRLFMRRAGDNQDDQDKARKGTRFIVDMDLSRLGRVQLDGLVYQKEKHMDLIVRTENRLPDKMHEDIRDIFQEASDVTGIKGGISFQAAPPNFVEPIPPAAPEEHLGLIV